MKRLLFITCVAMIAMAGPAQAHHPTARDMADFEDLTPKAAKSPPGVYICWGDNKIILGPAQGYGGCYQSHAAVEAKLKARRAELKADPQQQGCLGRDWLTCAATISLTDQITTGILPGDLVEPLDQRDLDGKLLAQHVRFDVFPTYNPALPQATRRADHFDLHLDDAHRVTRIEVRLTTAPSGAETQRDWDETGVYELVRGIMGDCVGDRLEFYKMYRRLANAGDVSHYDTNTGFGDESRSFGSVCGHGLAVNGFSSTDVETGVQAGEGFVVG